jgi:hypothetical protein
MKFEIHFEFRGSLRNFQDLNFWDDTLVPNASYLSITSMGVLQFQHQEAGLPPIKSTGRCLLNLVVL